ncbi:glycosyltransferase [Acidovorax sp. SDU_ACID1]|uniref:glycosyltransferase n=1 Tax=Acidovorax sp. SDU_ACID1 TaxID=3136632 RepID=UPI0038735F88
MIAIVVPAHDEERHLGACLRSLRRAARCPRLEGEDVLVVVALDCCTDGSHAVAVRWGALTVHVQARNVGLARAAGAQAALAAGARWLAFTDADSRVAPDWLSQQLAQRSDAVCGTVQVQDWREHTPAVRAAFEAGYRDADGHGHIHGANLGVSAHAYSGAGGFAPLVCHEDVALVRALQAWGARIAWSAAPRVTTSARRSYRACEGFGATLERLALPSLHPMGAAA